MSSSKRGYAKNMDIVFHSLFSCFFWGLEKRTYIHIKTNICVPCSHYFGTSIVTILSHFRNHDSWSPSILFCKYVSQLLGFAKCIVVFYFFTIHTRKSFYLRLVTSENGF